MTHLRARGSLRVRLREETRDDHRLIDATLSTLDLAVAAHYRDFLSIHRAALGELEDAWRPADRPDFAGLLHALDVDLAALGGTAHARAFRARADVLQGWGVGYVIRGSRLGSILLRKRVAAHLPTAYLDFVPQLDWPGFLTLLDQDPLAQAAPGATQVIDGAKVAFSVFGTAAAAVGVVP